MQRSEAISYLKQILGTDVGISPDSISLEKQQDRNIIKIRIKSQHTSIIKDIAKKRNLEVKEENDSLVIYSK